MPTTAVLDRCVAAFGIEVHDLFAVVEGIGRREILREDGVHFTEVGSRLLGGSVAAASGGI